MKMFFLCRVIPEGQELSYNYGYMVGSKTGHEMQCRCGAAKCKGRLL